MNPAATKRHLINPAGTERIYDEVHLSQANRVGNLVWVSGQIGIDPATGAAAHGMAAQARIAFQGVRSAVQEAGGTLDDVVELTTFHTDIEGDMGAFVAAKDEFFPDRYPAWTAVGVAALSPSGLLVEVRAVAAIGSGAA